MPDKDEILERIDAEIADASARLKRLQTDPLTKMCFPPVEPVQIEIEEEQ
jgi:hypothetical protein